MATRSTWFDFNEAVVQHGLERLAQSSNVTTQRLRVGPIVSGQLEYVTPYFGARDMDAWIDESQLDGAAGVPVYGAGPEGQDLFVFTNVPAFGTLWVQSATGINLADLTEAVLQAQDRVASAMAAKNYVRPKANETGVPPLCRGWAWTIAERYLLNKLKNNEASMANGGVERAFLDVVGRPEHPGALEKIDTVYALDWPKIQAPTDPSGQGQGNLYFTSDRRIFGGLDGRRL